MAFALHAIYMILYMLCDLRSAFITDFPKPALGGSKIARTFLPLVSSQIYFIFYSALPSLAS